MFWIIQAGLVFGAAVPFAEMIDELRRELDGVAAPEAYSRMADHIERIAGTEVNPNPENFFVKAL